jgi:hypothetical protein
METSDIAEIILGLFGIFFVIFGIHAIKTKNITLGDPEGIKDPITQTGRSATAWGWGFILFGICMELVALLLIITPD